MSITSVQIFSKYCPYCYKKHVVEFIGRRQSKGVTKAYKCHVIEKEFEIDE